MHYYTIPPFEHLSLDQKANHYLVVAQWLDQPTIQSEALLHFYKKRAQEGAKIILDNGMHEFREVYPIDKYLEMAKDIGVEILVAPDVWGDADETTEVALDFWWSLSEEDKKRFQIMGVPHGKDLWDYINCFNEFEDFSIIGMAKDEWGDRTGFIRPFFTWHLPIRENQEPYIHLLGLTHVNELTCCNPYTTRSFDTSMPYKMAMGNLELQRTTQFGGKYKVDAIMNDEQKHIALLNLQELRQVADCPKFEFWQKIS